MARWNLGRGLEMAALLRQRWPERWDELVGRLGLDAAELRRWRRRPTRMFTGFEPETGLFEQFAGYFDLEPIDLSRYADRTVPMDVMLGRERTQQRQVVKQADVVMLLALLPDECDARRAAANFRFYEPRCGHGSSLSRGMHALVARPAGRHRAGDALLSGDRGDRPRRNRRRQRRRRAHRGARRAVASGGLRVRRPLARGRCAGVGPASAGRVAHAGIPCTLAGAAVQRRDRSGRRCDQCHAGERRGHASVCPSAAPRPSTGRHATVALPAIGAMKLHGRRASAAMDWLDFLVKAHY